jgi:hypothetical protein
MSSKALVVRGTKISEDANGHILLDDLWALAKARESKAPKFWKRSRAAKALIAELQKQVINSNLRENKPSVPVIYAKRGLSGTFAHPILAASYAGHLSAKLEIEVREVWLRYRAGDATLADEILQKATKEENLWAGKRAMARSQRVSYTDVLRDHGVQGRGYMDCTDAVYERLFDGKAYELRNRRGLPRKANLRDNFDLSELSYVMAAEALSSERITEEDRLGNADCMDASATSASAIRRAIEEDRRNRQPRLKPR